MIKSMPEKMASIWRFLKKRVGLTACFLHSLIHELGDPVVVMASDELGQRPRVEFAAECLQPRRKSLGIFEDVIRDRHGCFHTTSTTARRSRVKAFERDMRLRVERMFSHELPNASPFYDSSHHFEAANKR